jgi:hypothetical protein
MKRIAIIAALVTVVAFAAATASAQATSSGGLTTTATVNGSINLLFNSDASGVTLTGSGTNAATLAFGNVSAYGSLSANVGRSVGGISFTVSSPFDVQVSKVNSASANYTLKAQLNTADAVNTWQVGGNTITSASQVTITSTGAYATNVPYTLALTIPFATASGTNISNIVNFTATAN